MTAPQPEPAFPYRAQPGGAAEAADDRWAYARDQRFARFFGGRLADAELCGSAAERRTAADITDLFREWLTLREVAGGEGGCEQDATTNALGWLLRWVAFMEWAGHPQWELGFHPAAYRAPLDHLFDAADIGC
ncbi:hypothetical protein [Streptomyces gibsoniae]|uniref:Uncharacterized protein n=1 Tax=Streptomyces gibsoniae TaxID=3075529 RepID=A0ABU2TYV0_9ACTN|nr:hypothetical protein [Streptomyces sp. DSM 41699]MDT0466142.1 hypothetical protein [Streptomyces sp. DSM 41699]